MPPTSEAESVTRRRRSWWRIVVGAVWVVTVVVCAVRSGPALVGAHPAYPVTLAAVAVFGVILVATGLRAVPADRPGHPVATVLGRVLGAFGTILLIGMLGYLIPYSATSEATAAMGGDASVRVESSPTRIRLTPTATPPRAGLVFQPGAKVDLAPTFRY
ncbi:MAG: hypothetical protein ABJA74_04565 [Lapillicoccus sp.]